MMRWIRLVVSAVALLSAPADAYTQTNRGAISGTVVDATGGVLPGATVTVIDAGTGAERHVTTSASGTYTVIDLEPVSYRFGAVVVRDGEESDALYIIVSGRARVLKVGDHGDEVTLGTLERGDTFGATGLLLDQPRAATVRASSQLEVLRLAKAVFRGLIARHHDIREYLELDIRLRSLRTFFLLHTPFARLPEEALASMLRAVERVDFAAGDLVIREGDPPGALYVVEDGHLRAFTDRDGERRDLAHYGTGDVFGERSLLAGTPRAASVEAITACQLLALPTAGRAYLGTIHNVL